MDIKDLGGGVGLVDPSVITSFLEVERTRVHSSQMMKTRIKDGARSQVILVMSRKRKKQENKSSTRTSWSNIAMYYVIAAPFS